MSDEPAAVENASAGRWFLPSLIISFLAVGLSLPILRLFTVDIARAFQVPTGVAAQLTTVNSIAEVAVALAMSFLVVRFKSKSLLLVGIVIVATSAVGSFFAPTFGFMLFFFAMEGAGSIMVAIMGLTLIGDYLALSKKAKAISYVMAATFLSFLIGIPVVNFIANVAGWRSLFILFVLPASVAGLALAYFSVPSLPHRKPPAGDMKSYLGGFKQVLLNKSAASCLVGGMLVSAVSIGLFSTTFYMEQFSLTRDSAGVLAMIAIIVSIVATLVAGRLLNRVARKTLTVASAFIASILTMLVFLMPNLSLALTFDMTHLAFAGIGAMAFVSYTLEQAPKSRGTMMSLRTIFGSMGDAIGAGVGGVLLFLFAFDLTLSYRMVGIVFGAIGIAASAVFYFLTKDPTAETTAKGTPTNLAPNEQRPSAFK